MKLAIFDIDGTLTNTNDVDNDCFVKAFAESLGITPINSNWAEYPHTSDSGITDDIFQKRFGRAPTAAELTQLKTCFVSLLKGRYRSDSANFTEISGASIALEKLKREFDWGVAIATGCWRESALLKLRVAKIEVDEIPIAYAEDGLSREEILQAAIARALSRYEQISFERIVSIGDAVWDVRAASHLKLAFIGVGAGESAERLHQAGAADVIENFIDYAHFVEALGRAQEPS